MVSLQLMAIGSGRCQEPVELTLTAQQRDELAEPVVNAVLQLKQQGDAALIQYLQTVNLGSLDQPEPSESAAAISGASLSKPFFGRGGTFNEDRLLDGRGMVRTNDEYKTSIALLAVIEILTENQSAQLIEWLVGRSSRAPATRCDNVIRASLPNDFNGFSAQFWQNSRNHWKAMLTATNPAYRLIAIRNAPLFETDGAVLLNDYQSGLNETNTLLQNAAFEGLKVIGTPTAKAALQTFLNQQRAANDGTMLESFDINAVIQEYLNPPAP